MIGVEGLCLTLSNSQRAPTHIAPGPFSWDHVRAAASDLVIVGLQRLGRQHKVFSERVLEVARRTDRPMLMISSRS